MRVNEFGIVFFAVANVLSGILMLVETVLSRFTTPHIGVLGVLSIALGFTIIKKRREAVILISLLFLPMIVFGAVTLYTSLMVYLISRYLEPLFISVFTVIYLVLAISTLIYVIKNKKNFVW